MFALNKIFFLTIIIGFLLISGIGYTWFWDNPQPLAKPTPPAPFADLNNAGETWRDNFTNDLYVESYENLTVAHTLAGNYTQNYDQNQVRLPITFINEVTTNGNFKRGNRRLRKSCTRSKRYLWSCCW